MAHRIAARGWSRDIILPDNYNYIDFGEKEAGVMPLPYDEDRFG
ncbi:MAG: hypothetical protein U5L96_15285 [Owenweeksia sp.]|nr:hypothetical protein [Owenweeksia sp.]